MLTPKQLRELRSAPATSGNRVQVAIELVQARQMDIAAATGLPQPYVSDVARGRYQSIEVKNAHKFADYFGCAIEDLFPAREQVAS